MTKKAAAGKSGRSRPLAIKIHVNAEEKKALEDAAEREMLPVATWARRVLLAEARNPDDPATHRRERERTRSVLAQALRALETDEGG